jgi:NADPH:quinone reductase-like Zn-dependent oxidoreductase
MRALLCFLAALGGASAFHAGAPHPLAAPVLRRARVSSAVGARMQAEAGKGKLLVLGGTGFVGSTVAKLALDRGYEVVSMSRRGKPPADSKLAGQAQVLQHQSACRVLPCR